MNAYNEQILINVQGCDEDDAYTPWKNNPAKDIS